MYNAAPAGANDVYEHIIGTNSMYNAGVNDMYEHILISTLYSLHLADIK